MKINNYYHNLVTISVLLCFSVLTNAMDSLPDPTRPANFIGKENNEGYSDQKTTDHSIANKTDLIPDLKLQAIRISRTVSMAIINGQVVFPGQSVSSATLLKVNHDSVLLDYKGRSLIVSLLPDTIKKRTSK